MITLYPDQQEVIDNLRDTMSRSKSILLQSPTGSGKTAMAVHLMSKAAEKGKRVVFTVPRRELMKQTSKTFDGYGIHHGFIASGQSFNPYSRAYVGMIDTMARRIDRLPIADMVIVDETHFGAGSLDAVIKRYKAMGAWVIGLSATPWKLSGQGLGCWYDEMVQGKSIRWLIDNKRLSDYRFFRGKTRLDFSGLSVTAGDYAKGELAEFMEQRGVIIGDCVNDYRQRAMGRLHVVRCASIKHSQMTAESFRNAGIPAQHVDGTTPDDDMRRIIRAYARRELLVLTFCDLLNFGFDLSQASGMDVCVESGDDLKPSKSLSSQMQFWGRMLRYKDYPAIIMDRVNNWIEHGLPCADREWSLEDRSQGKKKTERVPPTRQCDKCFMIHSPAPKCPNSDYLGTGQPCGHVYEIKSRDIDEADGELEEIDRESIIAEAKKKQLSDRIEVGTAKTIDDLQRIAAKRGYKPGWIYKMAAAKGIVR